MRIKFSIVIALCLAFFYHQTTWAATQIQATVSDNLVALGDRFILTVTIDDTDSDYRLDTKALEKDFNVSRPSRSSSNSYINGKSSSKTTWQITLQAKKLGEFTIPPLTVAGLSSKAITISVKKPSTQATKTADNLIFIENSVDKKSAYIDQPLLLTSKIYIAVNTNDLELLAPTLQGATITSYGEDKREESIRNGIRYTVITRRYTINVNKAGRYTIESPLLTGNIRKTVAIDKWRDRVISEPFNIRGDSKQVQIKAKPLDYQGEWLVSEDVRLFEDTQTTAQTYHVGDPITRTITLQVASIDPSKLPGIDFNYPKNLRFYPDQDQLTEGEIDGVRYAQRTLRHAIIADQPGKLTLPAIQLAWWSSATDKQEFARIPARTLTILAAQTAPRDTGTTDTDAPPVPQNDLQKSNLIDANKSLIIWQISSALLLLALLAMIFYNLALRRSLRQGKQKKTARPVNQIDVNLQQAFTSQHPAAVYQALLNYAQTHFPTIKSLSQLAPLTNLDEQDKAALSTEIEKLEKACTVASTQWSSTQLSHLLKKHQQQKPHNAKHNIMQLNPS